MNIGNNIKQLRQQKNMTQEQIAEKLGVTYQAVSKWENDISCPDITLLPSLAKKLGMTLDELLVGEEAAPRAEVIPPEERKDFNKRIKK